MKNLMKSILVLTIAFGSFSINASNFAANIEVSRVESKLIKLTLDNLEDGITIQLKDSYGEIIYNENVNEDKYIKSFSLVNLVDGNYSLEFRGNTVIKIKSFSIENNDVVLNDNNEVVIFKPTVFLKGDYVYVNKLASDENETFRISIYDENSNLLTTENVTGLKNLGRKFNIALLETGKYDFVMESNGEVFHKTIVK